MLSLLRHTHCIALATRRLNHLLGAIRAPASHRSRFSPSNEGFAQISAGSEHLSALASRDRPARHPPAQAEAAVYTNAKFLTADRNYRPLQGPCLPLPRTHSGKRPTGQGTAGRPPHQRLVRSRLRRNSTSPHDPARAASLEPCERTRGSLGLRKRSPLRGTPPRRPRVHSNTWSGDACSGLGRRASRLMRDFTRPLHNLRTETCDDPKHAPVVLAVGSTTQGCAIPTRRSADST